MLKIPFRPERPNGPGWIVAEKGCHIWTGARSRQGYAQVRIGGPGGRLFHVHRIRYEREVGPIPEGMQLDHFACDNGGRGCCNPVHCRPVTPRENTLRSNSVGARNAAKTHCPAGHPLEGDNLDRWQLKNGGRKCRICKTERMRAYYVANRDAYLARDRARYQRRPDHRREQAVKGEAHPHAKLADADVIAIRLDTRSGAAIGRDYGVSRGLVNMIRRRAIWRHI